MDGKKPVSRKTPPVQTYESPIENIVESMDKYSNNEMR
jgi:hypothetical protein